MRHKGKKSVQICPELRWGLQEILWALPGADPAVLKGGGGREGANRLGMESEVETSPTTSNFVFSSDFGHFILQRSKNDFLL